MPKLRSVTNADIAETIDQATIAAEQMVLAMVQIGSGACEPVDDPLAMARRCINISRVFSEATAHFLTRYKIQDGL